MKRKFLVSLVLSIVCGVVVTLFFEVGMFESLELKTLDVRFRQFAQPERASKDVLIVVIDEKSLAQFNNHQVPWPWPRDFYAALVRYLHRGGAKAIVFDVLFANRDIDRQSTSAEETDGQFAKAIREAGNVVLGTHLRNEERFLGGALENPLEYHSTLTFDSSMTMESLASFTNAVLPISQFQEAARSLGVVNYREDADGICRRLPLFSTYRDNIFPQLGLDAYLVANGVDKVKMSPDHILHIGDVDVPLDDSGQFLISWYGKGGPSGCFQYLSVGALISSAIEEERNQKPAVPSSYFKDKYVFIGSNAAGLFDLMNTPFTAYEPYPGTEIHATLLSNLLQRDFLIRSSRAAAVGAILFFALVICLTFVYVPRVRYVILISLLCAAGWLCAASFVFQRYNVWLDLVAPESSILLSFLLAAVTSYQTEGKARRHLRSVFGRYLSPAVITEVIDRSETVELGGKEIAGTVLFSDIKDFTSISEQLSAPELVVLLNDYFSLSTEIILTGEGLLDKYLGDAIMAIWGAPLTTTDHARRACAAALEMQRLLRQRWTSGATNRPRLETRIGINTGPMVVGNIGSYRRLEYTAIGNTVNIASRLEGVNKIFRTNIIIGSTTYDEVKDIFVARELDVLRVKGKKEAIAVFELIGKPEDVTAEVRGRITRFESARGFYRERAFDRALDAFQSILSVDADDGPSHEYADRCRRFLHIPPQPDWDGINNLDVK